MNIKISGLQPLTLLDYPGKLATIVFLPGCNFNCPYCHNSELNTESAPLMNTNEVLSYLNKRKDKLQGIVISGGEPTMQDITPLLYYAKELGYYTKVDTNGTHPQKIREWIDKKLIDYIAMDIKNTKEKYTNTIGHIRSIDISPISESIQIITNLVPDYEFRTTVTTSTHTVNDIKNIAKNMISGAKNYFIQPFSYTDTVPDNTLITPSKDTLLQMKEAASPYVKNVTIRNLN